MNAWESCGAYTAIRPYADLLIGMCAFNSGITCYSRYNELIALLDSGLSCIADMRLRGSCSSECSAGTAAGVQTHGCCTNVVIDFETGFNNNEDEFEDLFFDCGVSRPGRCTSGPLALGAAPPSGSTLASAAPPSGSTLASAAPPQGSSASHAEVTLMSVASVCLAAVLVMY